MQIDMLIYGEFLRVRRFSHYERAFRMAMWNHPDTREGKPMVILDQRRPDLRYLVVVIYYTPMFMKPYS